MSVACYRGRYRHNNKFAIIHFWGENHWLIAEVLVKRLRFLTVFDSVDMYADNCVQNSTFLKVGIDLIGIVMLSGPPLLLLKLLFFFL